MGESHIYRAQSHRSLFFWAHFHIRKWKGAQSSAFDLPSVNALLIDVSLLRKHYFVCPPKCGVFVAAAKLSSPTVGLGATSRPTSVASSREGRVTPSHSFGRITPSNSTRYTPYSNGRVTPASTSRVLSEAVTPSARPRIKTTATSLHGKSLECFFRRSITHYVRDKPERQSWSRAYKPHWAVRQ
jgi:hypothetical protein